jgi:hypothetical protein
VGSFNVALSFLIPAWSHADTREVWCKDNTQPHKQEDGGMCLFQSIWLLYWVLNTCCWWFVQGLDLYLRIVKNKKAMELDEYQKYYHMFAWGYPLLISTIMLGTQRLVLILL